MQDVQQSEEQEQKQKPEQKSTPLMCEYNNCEY